MNPLSWSDRTVRLVRYALTFVSAFIAAPTLATVFGDLEAATGTWRVYRGSGYSTFVCSANSEAAAKACAAADAESRRATTRYQIRYPNRYGTATYTPPTPTPTPTPTPVPTPTPTPTPAPGDYVASKWATSSGSTTSSCTQTEPCSLARAMATAVAGDVVSVAAGVHTTACNGQRHLPAFNPARSGTATAPITFFGPRTGTRAELRCASGAGPVLGTYGRTDIVLDGLTVNENNSPSVPDTGPMVVWQSDRIKLRSIQCTGKRIHVLDNHNCLRLEYARDIEITDGVYTGTVEDGPPGQNTACVMAYDATRVLFRGNTVTNCDVGLFIKGQHALPAYGLDAWRVERNTIEGSWAAVHIGGLGSYSQTFGRSTFTDNLIRSVRRVPDLGGWGILLHVYDGISPRAFTIANNTIVTEEAGIASIGNVSGSALTDIEVRDNIIVSGVALNYGGSPSRGGFRSDYNLVSARVFGSAGGFYADGWPSYASLLSWQTATGQDRNSRSLNPNLTSDYKLPAGSPGLTASSTGGVVGVR